MASQITDQMIAAALGDRVRPAKVELADTVEPGLSVRIGAQGARWTYRSRAIEESRLRLSLGAWPDVSVHQARVLVNRLKGTFVPVAAEPAEDITVGGLLERYDARRLSQFRKHQVILRALTTALATVSHRQATTINRRDISEIVDVMADRAPIHANRTLAYTKAFFGWAVGRGYLESNPAAGISKPSREIARDRTPTLEELVEIWDAAGDLSYPFGPAIRLLILTATRRDEIGGMRTAEVSRLTGSAEGCWTLPARRSKNGRAIRMPLAPLAMDILNSAMESRRTAGPFVFSTTGETSISGWSRAKSRIDALIQARRRLRGVNEDMPPWRIHDLRRAFATAACDILKVDPAIADRCLNHVGASTTSTVARVYGRSELYEPRRDALFRWAELVLKASQGIGADLSNVDPNKVGPASGYEALSSAT